MLVIIAIGVVISYWPICAAKIDLSNPGITLTELDEFSEFDHGELVRMLYSELKILKKEQKAMISVQNKLLATQEELRNRVNELETNNIHLQRQFENLLNSCGTKKNYESNLMTDFKQHDHGNATERNITNTPKKRAGTTKTGMVRGLVPLQVAFLVRLTNTEFPFAHGQTLIFDSLYANVGNAYNPHNGIFRAPVAGLYIVLFTVASDFPNRTPDIEVVMDGTVLCRAVVAVNGYASSSCNLIVHLNAGDNVWAKVMDDHSDNKIRGMVRGLVPLQVAFLVRLTNTEFPFAHGQTLIFDNLYANVGNAYNPHNGIFRAPFTGLYIVLFAVASEATRTPDIEVVMDGTALCRAVASLNGFASSSCNAIVHLNAGDNVWARVMGDHPESKIRGLYFSTFSMAMISSDEALSF